MKIAILGYGRMGQMVEKLALAEGHQVVYKTSHHDNPEALKQADVAIDFSIPKSAFSNIKSCLEVGVPVVSGTTGWLDDYDKIVELCNELEGSFLYASNFSIGVNLFFQLNKNLARLMRHQKDYHLGIEEIHHTGKKDKPSGTAISLAEDIIENSDKESWALIEEEDKNLEADQIPITSTRLADVKGTHIITYSSHIDDIEIKHTAHSREGFAKGAIMAAKFIKDKKGVFGMQDVLKNLI